LSMNFGIGIEFGIKIGKEIGNRIEIKFSFI
jgi:hypothetical protein